MLAWIKIQDLAIISKAYVNFESGLNVLTGETGAGKSILVDSIEFISGKRASSLDVRHGSPYAVIEGGLIIKDKQSKLWSVMERLGLPLDGDEIHLKRVISANGKSKAFVNLSPCTVGTLTELAKHWLDMTGQHSQSQLMDEKNYLFLLDQFCNHDDALKLYQRSYQSLKSIHQEIADLKEQEKNFAKEKDFLEYQFQELDKADLNKGEFETLLQQEKIAKNAEQLMQGIQTAAGVLDGESGLLDQVGQLKVSLKGMHKAAQNSNTETMCQQIDQVVELLNQISLDLSLQENALEFEPDDIEHMNQRLAQLQTIKRKYGDIDTAIAEYNRLKILLQRQLDLNAAYAELDKKKQESLKASQKNAQALHKHRQAAAAIFSNKVSNELKKLGMQQAEFFVEVSPVQEGTFDEGSQQYFNAYGFDQVRFVFSPNLGEGKKPLDTIVSGGELSRILLAIKSIAAVEQGNEKVFLFDEVDTGIGGETSERVGIHLKQLSFGAQVLCVTHLAQVACYADHHLYIEKNAEGGRTQAQVKVLSSQDQRQEIARMIGGIEISEKVLEHASELLKRKNQPI